MATRSNPGCQRWICQVATVCAFAAACAEPPAPVAAGAADVAQAVDAAADPGAVDAAGDAPADVTHDAAAEVADVAAADSQDAAADTGPADVGLPAPVTVPSDLPPGVVAVHLGNAAFDVVGKSKDFKLLLPADAVSALVVVRGAHPGFFQVSKIVAPNGALLAKGKCGTEPCIECLNRVGPMPATGAALLPSSSGVAAFAGSWTFGSCGFQWLKQGGTFAPNPYVGPAVESVAFFRTSPGSVATGGRLQLRIFCTGGGGLDAAKAPFDKRVVAMLAEASKVYAAIGIELAVVDVRNTAPGHTIIELPEDLTTTGASDLDLLFAEAGKVGGSAVIDLFLVEQLVGGTEGKGIVGGVAGGIPGPAFFHGIPRSGIAIAMGALGKDGALLGRTLAHEIGHFLGLWHPSEHHGKAFDPIDDTPECPAAKDANNDGDVSLDECAGLGADNVLFWTAIPKLATLSPGQAEIIRGHPLLLPIAPTATGGP